MTTRLNPLALKGALIDPKTGRGSQDFLDFLYRLWNRTGEFGGILGIGSGGTNSDTAAGARIELGLRIGTDIQAYDAGLQSLSGLVTVADRLPYATGSDVYAVTPFTAFARTILDDGDAVTVRATLGLSIGTNVQAYSPALASIAGLTTAADKLIYTTASNVYAATDLTSFARTLLDDLNAGAARATLGLGSTDTPTFKGVIIDSPTVPSSATDTGTAGTVVWDADYIYVCVATDTWKRVAISTW